MKDTVDITGRNIIPGDYIAYTTRQSSSMTTHIAKVLNTYFEDDYIKWRIQVVSLEENAWKWVDDHSEYYDKVYKTTLTSNDTIVILSHVPDKYRTALGNISTKY